MSDIPIRSSNGPGLRLLGQVALAVLAPIAAVLLALALSALLLQLNGFNAADLINVMVLGAVSDKRSIAEVLREGYASDLDRCRALCGVQVQHLEYWGGGTTLCGRLSRHGVRRKFRRASGVVSYRVEFSWPDRSPARLGACLLDCCASIFAQAKS